MSDMSTLYRLSRHNVTIEEFEDAIYCGQTIFPWCNRAVTISTDSFSWGYGRTIEIPAGSYIRTRSHQGRDPVYTERPLEYHVEDLGVCLEVIEVIQEEPIQLRCTRYIGVDVNDEDHDYTATVPLDRNFLCHREEGGIVIDGWRGDPTCILIPPILHGSVVLRASLGYDSLPEECRTFIVSDGVKMLDVTFHSNFNLNRIEIPNSVVMITPPTHVSFTNWFRKQPVNRPVYLAGYYCGSPGHGSGGETELVIRDGTIGVVDAADFQCYWHSIHIPDSAQRIGDFAFHNAQCLQKVRLPSDIKELGCGAFHNCPRLQSLHLPDGLTQPVLAFENCPALQNISLPSSCWDEEKSPFARCPHIEIRRGSVVITIDNETTPLPVNGKLTAYPAGGPLFIEGRSYTSAASLTLTRQDKANRFIDYYGCRVRFARYVDLKYYTSSGKPCWQNFWFVISEQGITMVTMDHQEENYLVLEGVTAQDVPCIIRRKVPDLFPEVSDDHE